MKLIQETFYRMVPQRAIVCHKLLQVMPVCGSVLLLVRCFYCIPFRKVYIPSTLYSVLYYMYGAILIILKALHNCSILLLHHYIVYLLDCHSWHIQCCTCLLCNNHNYGATLVTLEGLHPAVTLHYITFYVIVFIMLVVFVFSLL